MKFNPIPLITLSTLLSLFTQAQNNPGYELMLKSGAFVPQRNITPEYLSQFNKDVARTGEKSFAILQFENIPNEDQRNQLKQAGIELLEYIPNNAYTVTISHSLPLDVLQRTKARALIELSADQKMQPQLSKGIFPASAVKVPGTLDVWVSFPRSISADKVIAGLKQKNFDILSELYKEYRVISLRIAAMRLQELASLPFIDYVQAAKPEDRVINYRSQAASRANTLRSPITMGGRGLNGSGVTVGVGDNGDIQSHIDFNGRLINRADYITRAHASHVAGTIGGAGIIQELFTGFAPKSTLVSQIFSDILAYAPVYVRDHGMVITNNSYGTVVEDCNYNGLYDLSSRIVDQQAFDLPELQHVFAAGNDGEMNCNPYPPGFKTVLGGYQSAKNVITVGSTDFKSNVSSFSGKGPIRDGRLKPEIMSQGAIVFSTWVNNIYSPNNGTSMAAPGVSGGLALLVQRYRQLHGGANPRNSLLKALLCNGGADRGNPGPDYSYGFGKMDLLRSVTMMENSTYFNSSVANDVINQHTITVPSNTAQLKVLLYWKDPPAAVMATKSLVNDLDLQVVNTAGTIVLPALLDTIPMNVNGNATTGADHINNIEQVIIQDPMPGNYQLKVIGSLVAINPSQEYFMVYDIIPQGLVLTNPAGGEALVSTNAIIDTAYIQWDDYTGSSNLFTLEFSPDDGATWSTLNDAVPASARIFSWAVPAIATDKGRVRITKNGTPFTQTSPPFVITAMPVDSLAPVQCEGYINLGWRSIPGASDYEVMKLRGDEMVPLATTTSLNYVFTGLSEDSIYWVTVRPRVNGKPGRRAIAVSRKPNTGTCAGNISNNDLKIDSLLTPRTGRMFTSSSLSAATPISVRIKNLDDVAVVGFTIKYSVDGGPWVTENLPGVTITPAATYSHNFSTTHDFSGPGSYLLRVVVENLIADPVPSNDTLVATIRQLNNNPVVLTSYFNDDIEIAPQLEVTENKTGLEGIDRYDFSRTSPFGRLRTFVNSGISHSGSRAFTLDASLDYGPGNTNYLDGTFNMGAYDAQVQNLRLDFQFKNHGQQPNTANKIWIRGNDSSPWLEVYDLYNGQAAPGLFKRSESVELSRFLSNNAQNFSTSFQVRWGQNGTAQTTDNEGGAGYTFDDIRLYEVFNDVQLVSIDTPQIINCGLNANVPIIITVRNTTNNTLTNIPVQFNVDGGSFITENISSINANTTIQYSFTARADLSSIGAHRVITVVSYPGDSFRDNDSTTVSIMNLPMINSFPYLQNFETGQGSWYTNGKNNSWEYGTPASPKINRAASGSKAWKTSLAGYYNDGELSFLYSPCFDLSGMVNPTLSLSIAMDIEDCGPFFCDGAWVEYSNDGISWSRLGTTGEGTNWYNKNYSGQYVWSQQDYTRWHVASIALPTSNNNRLRVRVVFASDGGLPKEGIAVDDIHIYDNINGIYDGPTMLAPVVQPALSGSNWVDFVSGGKLVASILPNNRSLGRTEVQAYINMGSTRNHNGQYYHNRNITIKPGDSAPGDSASVRFYFLDSETDSLINASGCNNCTKPGSAYDLGVSKYSDPDDIQEDGIVANSSGPYWSFILPSMVFKIPFDKGYYAEFKVKDFSEFWLNDGGISHDHALPVQLTSFSATKTANRKDVLVAWTTLAEFNVDHFEIELARGNEAYNQNSFVKVGEVIAGNQPTGQSYSFDDLEANKSGVRYYRLKIIDKNGSFAYSQVRPVVFTNGITWQVYPNPSSSVFNLMYQLNEDEKLDLRLYDITGRLLYRSTENANGFLQKKVLDLGSEGFAPGLYLLEARTGEKKQVFRLVRQ